MQLNDVLSKLSNVERNGKQYSARCPNHKDDTNSLSITADSEKIALFCHAGCETQAILDKIGLKLSDLFLKPLDNQKSNKNIEYHYYNEEGVLVHKSVKYYDDKGKKHFYQSRPDGKGNWINGLSEGNYGLIKNLNMWQKSKPNKKYDEVREFPEFKDTILYNLRALIDAVAKSETVYITEGEKDVENLKTFNLVATTNPMGAGKWRDHYNKYFKGADVVIFPDNDATGQKHSAEVLKNLKNSAKSVKIVRLPNLPEKGDVSDWIEAGGTKEQLLALVNERAEVVEKLEQKRKQDSFDCSCMELSEDNNAYWNYKGLAISNFTLQLEKIVKSEETEAHVLIHTQDGKEHKRIIPMDAFTSSAKLRRALSEEQFSFKGKDNDAQDIKVLMSRYEYLTVKGVEACGIHKSDNEEYVFVAHDKAVNLSNKSVDNLQQLKSRIHIKTDLLEYNPITAKEIQEISKHMFNFNDLAICGTIFGYMAGCFYKTKMKHFNRKYGHLFIQGQAGSGKSETVDNIITKFFGLISSPLSAGSVKEFALLKSAASSNVLPLLIDEYKPSRMSEITKNVISTVARSAYDGHIVTRGRADQSIVEYNLQSPLIIIGEAGADETAITERSLELMFSKMNHNPQRKSSFEVLKAKSELLTKLGRSILDLALIKPVEAIQQELKAIANDVDSEIKVDRIRNSLENCIFGLWQLSAVFDNAGMTFADCTGYSLDEVVTAINNSVKSNLGECGRSRSTVDRIIETFDTMALNGLLIENEDYKLVNNGAELALNTKRFYDRFLKYCKDCGAGIEQLDRNSFQKQLKTMPYYVEYKNTKFGSHTISSFILSTHKLTDYKLDLQRLLRIYDAEPYEGKVVQLSFTK